jgi:hypothetical protein
LTIVPKKIDINILAQTIAHFNRPPFGNKMNIAKPIAIVLLSLASVAPCFASPASPPKVIIDTDF